MGMHDSIKCEFELPDLNVQYKEFQTKSLDNNLSHYKIDKSGELFLTEKFFTDGEPECYEKMNYTGEILFYTNAKSDNYSLENIDRHFSYISFFINGKLIYLSREQDHFLYDEKSCLTKDMITLVFPNKEYASAFKKWFSVEDFINSKYVDEVNKVFSLERRYSEDGNYNFYIICSG